MRNPIKLGKMCVGGVILTTVGFLEAQDVMFINNINKIRVFKLIYPIIIDKIVCPMDIPARNFRKII